MDKKDKKVYKLSNGIKVLIIPMDTKLTHVSVSILLGSKHETKNNIEVTHFLEHLLGHFISQKYKDYIYINKELARRGAHTNAYVSNYETRLFIHGFWRDLEFFLDLLSNVLSDFHLDKELAEKERLAVIQERQRHISDDHYEFFYEIDKFLFPKYAYQFDLKRHIKFIKSYDINKLHDFLKTHISLQNMTISITCPKESVKKTQSLISKYFGVLQNKNNPKLVYPIYQYKPKQGKIVYIKKPNKDLNVTLRLYRYKKIEFLSTEHLCLRFLIEVLFNFETGIFFKKLRKELGIIYSIGMYIDIDWKDPRSSHYCIYTTADHLNVPRLIAEILKIFQSYTLTDEDIENAKNVIFMDFEYMKFFNLTSYNNHYELFLLHNKPIIERSEILEKYKKVTNKDIRKYFEIMKHDIMNYGVVFYYSKNNLNKKIKTALPPGIKYKLQAT